MPFVHTPQNLDRELEASLMAEWPAILHWMIEGCLDWQENGLVRPQSVVDATAEYFDDQDLVAQWLNEKCTVDPGNTTRWAKTGDLFKSWKDFAIAAGEEPGTQKALAGKLHRHGLVRGSKRVDNSVMRIWMGVDLKIKWSNDGL